MSKNKKRLEGGDFLPFSEDLCFIGVGLRTNWEAVKYMLKHDLFGTRRVAVVADEGDFDGDRMHLDTFFSILDTDVVIVSEDVIDPLKLGDNNQFSKRVRHVTEFLMNEGSDVSVVPVAAAGEENIGNYVVSEKKIEFYEYLSKYNRLKIIIIPSRLQVNFGCNVLNLGNNQVLCTNEETARLILQSGLYTGGIVVVPFDSITAMNGGLHCSTFIIR